MAEGATRAQKRRVLWGVLWANVAFMAVEGVGGLAFHSLALLADAAHMLTDVVALAIALGAQALVERSATARHTYGFQRAEVLGALTNGLILIGAMVWLLYEAVRRVWEPIDVSGGGVIVVAVLGLVVNAGSAALTSRSADRSLNMRAAYLHMLADALGSVGALAAGAAVALWGLDVADPIASVGIAGLVLWASWNLLRETVQVLLEGAPVGMDVNEVEAAIAAISGVESVHHLHVWNLTSEAPALSAHVVVEGDVSLHEAQRRGDRLKEMLASRFGIEHATLEFECHACEPVYETERPHGH